MENPCGHEVEGVFKLYDYCLKNVNLSGPTYFAPLIKEVVMQTGRSFAHDPNTYSILLILTDGVIHDMGATKDFIVEGSSLPLSVIVIGVGNADFSQMEELDSDGQVDFHELRRLLVAEVQLREILCSLSPSISS
jgi:copine 5/8/9